MNGAIADEVEAFFGKPVPVFVRSAAEMAAGRRGQPVRRRQAEPGRWRTSSPSRRPRRCSPTRATSPGERMALGPRMIYVSYGEGIGKTKLKLPAVARRHRAQHEQRRADGGVAGMSADDRSGGRQPADAAGAARSRGTTAPITTATRPRSATPNLTRWCARMPRSRREFPHLVRADSPSRGGRRGADLEPRQGAARAGRC